jgi:TonB family protein
MHVKRYLSLAVLLVTCCVTIAAPPKRVTPLQAYQSEINARSRLVWESLVKKYEDLLSIGTVKVHFEILPDGHVVNAKTTSNTANNAAAEIALETVRSTKFPPIPKALIPTLKAGRLDAEYSFETHLDR